LFKKHFSDRVLHLLTCPTVTVHEWVAVPKVLARFAQREYMNEVMSVFWIELGQFIADGLSTPDDVIKQRRQEFDEREQKREEWVQRALVQHQEEHDQQEEHSQKPQEKKKSKIYDEQH
jgi:hypothetical protein